VKAILEVVSGALLMQTNIFMYFFYLQIYRNISQDIAEIFHSKSQKSNWHFIAV
jgi:hypothetical protein